ncbi:polysaccharide pyruvyl transferase family protein [Rhizobium paknamense]|uniref:Colanic acid/amylovoran biosynthesis protein n=1 Tax=Rhizobium paknamense TaxID=1206817 RepID=A0ABU0IL88_9HYPH|nr:polysaccharide pyruvyl transferase family protein [Rhizobium paknamense]MDQ0458001.1 colanic acid/amylovoran biosynthesis protein [Rhizobium paknamense]
MKVVVENTVCLNTGDAAILLAIRHILKTAFGENLHFYIFDSQPEVAARLYSRQAYPDLSFRRLLSETMFKYSHAEKSVKDAIKPVYNRVIFELLKRGGSKAPLLGHLLSASEKEGLRNYEEADLVVTTGGTYLVETYNIEKRLNQFELDEILGKPPVFFTQSLGPFKKEENRRRLKTSFDKSPLILLRDAYSRDNIVDFVNDPSKCHVVADSVFALADQPRIESLLASGPKAPTGRVAVSVRHWDFVKGGGNGMNRYIESIRRIVTDLVRQHGKQVVFLSTCQGVPEYGHDDSKTAKAIVAGLEADVAAEVSVDDGFHTPEQLMAKVKDLDFVVATRMHMMIMSLCVGTPVLPIAYEFKTKELSKRIGIDNLLLEIDTVTPEQAAASLETFINDFDHYRPLSLKAVLEEHASAMSAAALLKQAIRI